MRYYRDLQPDETLRPGDEKLQEPLEWVPVNPAFYGVAPSARYLPEYRRPVDLPTLQPVTPEAMAELEGRERVLIVHISDYDARHLSHGVNGWWEEPAGRRTPRPPSGWFIELSKLKEVQQ